MKCRTFGSELTSDSRQMECFTNEEPRKAFSIRDNLTTLMFIIPSDLSEAQRERLTSLLSLRGVNVTACTFESVRTVFVELFCTPPSSMENLPLCVSGHVSSMNRTFIVENYAEDDFGQCAKDDVAGEQGYIDDERSCFWTWGRRWVCLAVQTIQGPSSEKKKGKRNKKRKGSIQKEWNRNSLATNRCKIPNGGQKNFAWWSKAKKGNLTEQEEDCFSRETERFVNEIHDHKEELRSNNELLTHQGNLCEPSQRSSYKPLHKKNHSYE